MLAAMVTGLRLRWGGLREDEWQARAVARLGQRDGEGPGSLQFSPAASTPITTWWIIYTALSRSLTLSMKAQRHPARMCNSPAPWGLCRVQRWRPAGAGSEGSIQVALFRGPRLDGERQQMLSGDDGG